MTEAQISGLALMFAAVFPCYFLAVYIEKHKHYTLFSGWDASRISDEDACGKMMCQGVKVFSWVMAAGGAFIFVTGLNGDVAIIAITVLSLAPLMYYILRSRKLYWK
ncbi:MAG: hypothetical protein DHS20C12_10310 [Pseudohongiella sp.]|nr:MAG: hypothetical protein DHS20C12_10310 [Pseudohongiella sp.]